MKLFDLTEFPCYSSMSIVSSTLRLSLQRNVDRSYMGFDLFLYSNNEKKLMRGKCSTFRPKQERSFSEQ